MKGVRSISSILFAILVVISSTNFTIGMHFCMGKVENVALFGKAESCQKEKALSPCHKQMLPGCCEDEVVYHEGTDFKASIAHYQIVPPAPVDIERPVVFLSVIIPAAPVASIQYYKYDPPLRTCDLTVEHQVFLI